MSKFSKEAVGKAIAGEKPTDKMNSGISEQEQKVDKKAAAVPTAPRKLKLKRPKSETVEEPYVEDLYEEEEKETGISKPINITGTY